MTIFIHFIPHHFCTIVPASKTCALAQQKIYNACCLLCCSWCDELFCDIINLLNYINGDTTRENRSSEFPTRPDINRHVQSLKKARSLEFRIKEEDVL